MSVVQEISTDKKYREGTAQGLWAEVLAEIKCHAPAHVFSGWFEPIVPVRYESGKMTIQVPSTFFIEYIRRHYSDLMLNAVAEVLGGGATLTVRVVEPDEPKEQVQIAVREIVKDCNRCRKPIVLVRNLHKKYTPCEPGVVTVDDDFTKILDKDGLVLVQGKKTGHRLHNCHF